MPISKTSKAWLYFSTKDDPKSQKAVCSLCEKEVACSGGTTNISKNGKYLCVKTTSESSEQLFSTAGNIVNKKRGTLLPENVEKFVISSQ